VNVKMMTDISIANPVVHLRDEYERQRALFLAQPIIVQRFIESQAQRLAEAVTNNARHVRLTLPDRVTAKVPQSGELAAMLVPVQMREQTLGRWQIRYTQQYLRDELRLKLSELEQSPDQSINASASLLRYVTAIHMVHNMLPAGRSVTYRAELDEQIPSIPEQKDGELESALTSAGDAIVEQGPAESGRGELPVPFVPAARRFYLPQWVAFDDRGKLLVNSINEAEANQASMERYVAILHMASSLATYIVADETYQHKRYGMLGQTINQGRALALYKTEQIIKTVLERAQNGTLNRGLSISLPYYDDQELRMAEVMLEVIPAGRIMFKPIFVVRAARLEHAKVSQDTRFNPSTRMYLFRELDMLETAFIKFHEQVKR
jgi:hypothetical protein